MSDFSKVLIKDDRLMCSPEISYAVMKGAMNHTMISYNALTGAGAQASADPTSLTFNIQVPSEQIVLDRRVMIENKFRIVVRKTLKTSIAGAVGYGERVFNNDYNSDSASNNTIPGADCLNVYPFHQLINSAQITINNTSVSVNIQDVLPALIRVNDNRDLNKFNGSAPIQVDSDGNYGSTIVALADGNNSFNKAGSPFSSDWSATDEAYSSRGAFVVRDISNSNVSIAVVNTDVSNSTTLEFTTLEPIMVSPFTFSNPQTNSQGIYGLQNLSFNFNLGGKNRLIRSRPAKVNDNVAGTTECISYTEVLSFQLLESALHLVYLTPQPTDALASRNAVPYYELPRYITPSFEVAGANWTNPRNPLPTNKRLSFNSIQLNQIPDKLFIFVRQNGNTAYNTNTNCADFMLPIVKVNVNFNNQSGLLSTMTPIELYRMSRDNGSSQSWLEFSGLSNSKVDGAYRLAQNGYAPAVANLPVSAGNANNTSVIGNLSAYGQSVLSQTTGSLLILQFGKDIELPDYYAPGSLGNFNLQMDITVDNYNNTINPENYQIVCITMNSGVFITEKGQSATYTGLLTKEDVLQASAMEAISTNDYRRLVGSGFWDNLKSIGTKAWNFAKPILGSVGKYAAQQGAQALQQSGNPLASLAGNVLGRVVGSAGGMSGGVEGGAMSAGRRRVMKHLAQ